METIVTVTCDRDRYQLYLQAHSFEKYLDEPVQHIVVIESTKHDINKWKSDLQKIYVKHKLVLMTKETHPYVFPTLLDGVEFVKDNGWLRQQIIKLYVSQVIYTPKYTIFDSKNLLVQTRSIYNFLNFEPMMIYRNWSNPDMDTWKQFAEIFHNKTNLPIPKVCRYPTTPFILDTETVRQLLASVNVEEIFLETASVKHRLPSEFVAYEFFYKRMEPIRREYLDTCIDVLQDADPKVYGSLVISKRHYLDKTHLDTIYNRLVNEFNLDPYYVDLALYETNPNYPYIPLFRSLES